MKRQRHEVNILHRPAVNMMKNTFLSGLITEQDLVPFFVYPVKAIFGPFHSWSATMAERWNLIGLQESSPALFRLL